MDKNSSHAISESSNKGVWLLFLSGLIAATLTFLAAKYSADRNVEIESMRIGATQTAEAKLTSISHTSTAAITMMPTLSVTPTVATIPTATPAASITPLPPIPTPIFGTNYRVQMSTGMVSSIHQAIPIHFLFSSEDKAKNLCIYVESYGHPMRVELWAGNISRDNLRWWESYQMLLQDPPSIPWKSKINPQLTYTVVPGENTVLIIRLLEEDPAPDITIDYNISLLSGSCPSKRPW